MLCSNRNWCGREARPWCWKLLFSSRSLVSSFHPAPDTFHFWFWSFNLNPNLHIFTLLLTTLNFDPDPFLQRARAQYPLWPTFTVEQFLPLQWIFLLHTQISFHFSPSSWKDSELPCIFSPHKRQKGQHGKFTLDKNLHVLFHRRQGHEVGFWNNFHAPQTPTLTVYTRVFQICTFFKMKKVRITTYTSRVHINHIQNIFVLAQV